MKHSKQRLSGQDARYRRIVFGCATATSCAALLLSAGARAESASEPAAADQSDEPTEIVVTGIRAAIESAINVKKNSDTIVEALSAEDIGKLPDTTIAESLARLPGVTTQRNPLGQATNVTIRGLGPDFNGYLLNGREQTSIGDSRAVDLSVYPAEFISSATVYKTGDAALMTAGLAGTIDNRLIDPLAYPGLVVSANAEHDRIGVGLPVVGTGKRYSLSFIDQFADRKVGVALGFVHSKADSSQLVNGSWGSTVDVTDTNGTDLGNFTVPFGGGLSFETDHNNDKRDSIAAIIDLKPNDNFTSEIDFYHAKINTQLKKAAVKRGSNGLPIVDATVSGTTVVSGTYDMPANDLIVDSENIFDEDTLNSVGWKNSLNFSDKLTGSLDLNHNSAKRVERDIEAYGLVNSADTLSFTNGGSSTPTFTFGTPTDYTDPSIVQISGVQGWSGTTFLSGPYQGQEILQAGYDKGPTTYDKVDGVRLDFKYNLGGAQFPDLQFGLNFTDRSKQRTNDDALIALPGDSTGSAPFPSGAYVESSVGGTGLDILTFDPGVGLWPGVVKVPKYNDDILSKTWSVYEKVTTAYGKLDINMNSGRIPIRGNIGLQLVHTDQSSDGYRANETSSPTIAEPSLILVNAGTTYTDVLPSLNLVGDLGNGNLLRLGAGIQIARPNMTDMRNSLSVGLDTTNNILTASQGNPNLKPFKADAIDLSYEKYFESKAYLSAAVFYKRLVSYITPFTYYNYDLSALATKYNVAIPTSGPLGTYTTTVDGSGGNLRGIELAASLPFDLFTHWLYGFGITGSYSSTLSSVVLPNLVGLSPTTVVPVNGTISLPNLSHINDKLELYYERWGFSAVVAGNHRSQYIGSVANTTVGGYPTLVYIADQNWLSAQVGYQFQSGFLKGLGLRFEGNNMNKPLYKEFKSDGTLNRAVETGATYAFKLSYKFE
ncbi:MAG TPA: TonB-dependent receptor [Steroidobacteraceae bacterium]|nr:TonB-dependent receptor [Steroidobacteraceae bacterium]